MNEPLDFPLPPTTAPYLTERAAAPVAAEPVLAPAPPEDVALTALRQKVAELEHVVDLAKTRVETLGAEKREALERALLLEARLEAAGQREAELLDRMASREPPGAFDEATIAELLHRVAALEAIVVPSQAVAAA